MPTTRALSTGDNLVTNAAIHLQSVSGVTLDGLNINGSAEQGINGNNVTNFSLTNSTIANTGNGPDEDGLHFFNLLGTGTITNTFITSSGDDNVNIQNQSGTAAITVTGGSFNTGVLGSGYLMGIRGTSNPTVTVDRHHGQQQLQRRCRDRHVRYRHVDRRDRQQHDHQQQRRHRDQRQRRRHAVRHPRQPELCRQRLRAYLDPQGRVLDGSGRCRASSATIRLSSATVRRPTASRSSRRRWQCSRSRWRTTTIDYRGTQRAILIQGGQDGAGQLNVTVTGNTIDMQLDGIGNAVAGILAQVAVASPSGDNTEHVRRYRRRGRLQDTFTHSLGGIIAAGDVRVRQRFVTTVDTPRLRWRESRQRRRRVVCQRPEYPRQLARSHRHERSRLHTWCWWLRRRRRVHRADLPVSAGGRTSMPSGGCAGCRGQILYFNIAPSDRSGREQC